MIISVSIVEKMNHNTYPYEMDDICAICKNSFGRHKGHPAPFFCPGGVSGDPWRSTSFIPAPVLGPHRLSAEDMYEVLRQYDE